MPQPMRCWREVMIVIKDHTLGQAIVEALRFVKAAKALRTKPDTYWGPAHASTLRASLDLSRCLVDLRQGR